MADPADLPLPRNQTATLALLLQLVVRGYGWHHVQTAPQDRILVAIDKLHEKHRVLIGAAARHARKEAGLPVAYLVLGPEPRGGEWPMVLLATGRLKGESMYRADRTPLTWLAWRKEAWQPTYILRRDEDRQRWTWYLHDSFYRQLLEEALHYTQTGNWPKLVAHLKVLGGLPAFHGIWTQVQDIRKRTQKAWGDQHLRTPGGQWKEPPWRQALEGWPKRPLGLGMRIWRTEPPRTVGEWLEMQKRAV